MKKKKVLISPIEISGYYKNLEIGLNSIGVDAEFVSFSKHHFYNDNNKIDYVINKLNYLYNIKSNKKYLIFFNKVLIEILKLIFFFKALFKYDVFIFGYGKSLLFNNYDLFFLRLFRKRIIMNVAHGSELRPPYIDGSYQSNDGLIQPSSIFLKKLTKKIFKKAKFIEKYSHVLIGSPFSSSFFLQKKFINSFYIGIPFNKIILKSNYNFESKRIRILHSPSNQAVKGTNLIRIAIDNLKKKGFDFDYIEIINQPNEVVLNEIYKSTFIIDQVFSDTPLAGLATEAAWYGKPSIVGGYGLNELKKFVESDLIPPSAICLPDDIEKKITEFIIDESYRNNIAEKAQFFVNSKWNIHLVAKKYLDIINDNYNKNWETDPNINNYILGVGQSKKTTIENIKKLVNQYGIDSLCLTNKKNLEKLFLNLINSI